LTNHPKSNEPNTRPTIHPMVPNHPIVLKSLS
jgi:hypothetical protein